MAARMGELELGALGWGLRRVGGCEMLRVVELGNVGLVVLERTEVFWWGACGVDMQAWQVYILGLGLSGWA